MYASGSFRPILCFDRAANADDWSALAFATDPRGCPEAMVDENGRITWEATIEPWGARRSTSATDDAFRQPLALPGQYVDATGLVYNRARYYMPDVGAYLSPDPIGLDGGDRFYAYADDPLCWIDPLGLANADYVPPPEVAACGPLQAAWLVRPGEFEMKADIRAVLPGQPMDLDIRKSDRYLYAVTEDGTVVYAPQSRQGDDNETVKHTTLAGEDGENPGQANPMRVSGEINYDRESDQWIMDGASGRYSSDGRRETRTPENVAAAAALANAEPGGTPVVPAPYVFPPRG
jgi:RHS repeat-associated protein